MSTLGNASPRRLWPGAPLALLLSGLLLLTACAPAQPADDGATSTPVPGVRVIARATPLPSPTPEPTATPLPTPTPRPPVANTGAARTTNVSSQAPQLDQSNIGEMIMVARLPSSTAPGKAADCSLRFYAKENPQPTPAKGQTTYAGIAMGMQGEEQFDFWFGQVDEKATDSGPATAESLLRAHDYVRSFQERQYGLSADGEPGEGWVLLFELPSQEDPAAASTLCENRKASQNQPNDEPQPRLLRLAWVFSFDQDSPFLSNLLQEGDEIEPTPATNLVQGARTTPSTSGITGGAPPSALGLLASPLAGADSGSLSDLSWLFGAFGAGQPGLSDFIKYAASVYAVFDSEAEAQQFFAGLAELSANDPQAVVTRQTDRLLSWQSDAGSALVARAGTRVLFAAGPDEASLEKLLAAYPGFQAR